MRDMWDYFRRESFFFCTYGAVRDFEIQHRYFRGIIQYGTGKENHGKPEVSTGILVI